MKKCICIVLIGIVAMSTLMPVSVHATVSSNNAAQIEMLQKLLLQLQEQLALLTKPAVSNKAPFLTYERKSNYVDETINKYGVTFRYQGQATCVSVMPEYKISFGDGKSAKADCKGVVDHVYEKDGTYTVAYSKKGRVLATTEVVIKNEIIQTDTKRPAPLFSSPDVTATMNVVSTGNRSIKITGVITPPKNCIGTEQMEVELLFSEQNKISYVLANCQPRQINMSTVYDSTANFVFPEIRVRWLNAKINTWTYTQLVRYRVDYTQSNTAPQIIKLTEGIKG
ncbi:PKD domain-containing protein [Patescibacteria group bacterium]|nr:PKD domain-containing protein [Patescibacteria group bacterium]